MRLHFVPTLLLVSSVAWPSASFSGWQSLKDSVIQADLVPHRSIQKKLAKKALELARQCVEESPREAACYYYQAQAKGVYHGNNFFGYVSRVRSMFQDWQKAMELDPAFDYGGPYRMFAEVYIALPKHFGPKDLRQDLSKAIDYLEKAVRISKYPTNYLDLAEALIKAKKFEEASDTLETVKKILPEWKEDPYFGRWGGTIGWLEGVLKKAEK